MVQDIFYEKGQHEAAMAVPDALADEISLSGPVDRIKERLQDWNKSAVTTLMIGVSPFGEDATRKNMQVVAEAVL
jgi:alkanesulfonate monooxygenase SsuD/methylene tetrahydromethanopterin reductase-like flavin-dependent oxidoreductase (luciferase family)